MEKLKVIRQTSGQPDHVFELAGNTIQDCYKEFYHVKSINRYTSDIFQLPPEHVNGYRLYIDNLSESASMDIYYGRGGTVD